MSRKFYLAAPYDQRLSAQAMADAIEVLTAGRWRCTSRWLGGQYDDLPLPVAAHDDVEDVRESDALIILHGESTSGGMWVELGIALERSMPVGIVIPTAQSGRRLPIFVSWEDAVVETRLLPDRSALTSVNLAKSAVEMLRGFEANLPGGEWSTPEDSEANERPRRTISG